MTPIHFRTNNPWWTSKMLVSISWKPIRTFRRTPITETDPPIKAAWMRSIFRRANPWLVEVKQCLHAKGSLPLACRTSWLRKWSAREHSVKSSWSHSREPVSCTPWNASERTSSLRMNRWKIFSSRRISYTASITLSWLIWNMCSRTSSASIFSWSLLREVNSSAT